MLIGFLDAYAEYDPSIEHPPRAATRPPDRYSRSLTASDCSDVRVGSPYRRAGSTRRSEQSEVGTIGVVPTDGESDRTPGRALQVDGQ